MFFDMATIPPFFHLLCSHMRRLFCVVPLLIVDSHPELSISPSPTPCPFRIYVSRVLRMTLNIFCSVMSQFPNYPSPWPHPLDKVDSAKSKGWSTRSLIQFSAPPTNNDQCPPAQLLLLGRRQCILTQRQISPKLNDRVCKAGGLSPSFTVPTSSASLRVYPFDCKIDGLLRRNPSQVMPYHRDDDIVVIRRVHWDGVYASSWKAVVANSSGLVVHNNWWR
jgi:hypothetical protein